MDNAKGRYLTLVFILLLVGWQGRMVADNVRQFTLSFTCKLSTAEPCRLLEIPDLLKVSIIDGKSMVDDGGQNYAAFPMKDGSLPVLEASLKLRLPVGQCELSDMKIGMPLSLLPSPLGTHDVELSFTGARWTLYVDGQLMDNDFPLSWCPTVWSCSLAIP